MSWSIGQDIVCVKTLCSNTGGVIVKEGDVFTIKQLTNARCGCDYIEIDVGIRSGSTYCNQCKSGKGQKQIDNVTWVSEKRFKPLDELVDISELTEVLNEPAFQ